MGAASPNNGTRQNVPGPFPDPSAERAFQSWYGLQAAPLGLDPNPDDPRHFYDYRGAFLHGGEAGPEGHFPSSFKTFDHPNRFVEGLDTILNLPRGEVPEDMVLPMPTLGDFLAAPLGGRAY